MEYHADRFIDYSVLCFRDQILVAICPAHKVGEELRSHWGLTYGGVLWGSDVSYIESLELADLFKKHLRDEGFKTLRIKGVPEFYLNEGLKSRSADLYLDAIMNHSEFVYAIDYSQPLSIHKTKLKHYKKGQLKGFQIECTSDFSAFWIEVLIPRLQSKHQVRPVHSLEEISWLASRFPHKIMQYNISLNGRILAGITLFDKGKVVKSQYGATTIQGEKLRALEFLFLYLIYKYKSEGRAYFSMGTAGDKRFPDGINPGLRKQKEELGCSEYRQQFYTFNL